MEAYNHLVNEGEIKPDPIQLSAIKRLNALSNTLAEYSLQMGETGWKVRLSLSGPKPKPPNGLYFWGGVGCGKTMLMDLFFDRCPVKTEYKKHVHFHAFMQEVHKRLHIFRDAQKIGKVSENRDPITALSKIIVDRAWLLCFDEFHITDIADAMILGRLFEALFSRGVVIVATSNRHPTDLYKDGLQRARFTPFIKLFMDKMEIFEFDNDTDYRLEKLRSINVYLVSSGREASAELGRAFDKLATGMLIRPRILKVNGRDVRIAKTAEGIAFTNFTDLCGLPLGPSDYLTIAGFFHTLILAEIPRMGPAMRDQAKRFVTLIDALYDAKVNLICSAEVGPNELYTEGDGAFEFERTSSRLIEMQSPDYMALTHRS
ncbi:MAG: cell division protein ZapE [Magnetovibrio sp.]|nr:cell division protein ZapE [Magnetovibrio sp.]